MTDDSLESVAAHGIRVRGPMGLVPRWSYAEPPEFGRLIADGAEDGRRWGARRVRSAVAAASPPSFCFPRPSAAAAWSSPPG